MAKGIPSILSACVSYRAYLTDEEDFATLGDFKPD